MYKILLAGQDSRLLATRAAVLHRISDHVTTCRNAAESLKFLDAETPNLVVLCHSLSAEDAEKIADKAHRHGEGVRVLMLVSPIDPAPPQLDGKFDGVSPPEPSHLIAQTMELLRELSDLPREEDSEKVFARQQSRMA